MRDCFDRGNERIRGNDDLITRLHLKSLQGQSERRRTVRDRGAVGAANQSGKRRFKGVDARSTDKLTLVQDGCPRGQDLLSQGGLALMRKVDERYAHGF